MRTYANLTLKIDAEVLLWARMRALVDGTSINRRVRQYLAEYAAIPPEKRWDGATPWPDEDPGPAGIPGRPEDHAHLYGRDGHETVLSVVQRDRRREYRTRQERRRG